MTTLHCHMISALFLQREPLIQALLHSTNFINQLLDEERKGHHIWTLNVMYTLCSCRWGWTCCLGSLLMHPNQTLSHSEWYVPLHNSLAAWLSIVMETEGVQDDIMGERTSREGDGHTCMLIDALFSALHESECCSGRYQCCWLCLLLRLRGCCQWSACGWSHVQRATSEVCSSPTCICAAIEISFWQNGDTLRTCLVSYFVSNPLPSYQA